MPPGSPAPSAAILETGEITLAPGATFSFDWAFLGNDTLPGDFGLFYLKDADGNIVFSEGLAQIGTAAGSRSPLGPAAGQRPPAVCWV